MKKKPPSQMSIDEVREGFEKWYNRPSYNNEERNWYKKYQERLTGKGQAATGWIACYRWLTDTRKDDME